MVFFGLGYGDQLDTINFGTPLELRCSAYVQDDLILLFRNAESHYRLYWMSFDRLYAHHFEVLKPLRCERVTRIQGYTMVYGQTDSGKWVYGSDGGRNSRVFETARDLNKLKSALTLGNQTNTLQRLIQGTL